MGLMGHDACGICQGDHHYTAHPDWETRLRGVHTLWCPGGHDLYLTSCAAPPGATAVVAQAGSWAGGGGSGGSCSVNTWMPGGPVVPLSGIPSSDPPMDVLPPASSSMIEVTVIGDWERTYLPGPAATGPSPLCDRHPGHKWAVAEYKDGTKVRCCGCDRERPGVSWRPSAEIRTAAISKGTCVDCHLENQELTSGRCQTCAELRGLVEARRKADEHEWQATGQRLRWKCLRCHVRTNSDRRCARADCTGSPAARRPVERRVTVRLVTGFLILFALCELGLALAFHLH